MAQPIFELRTLKCVANQDDAPRAREPQPAAETKISADEHERSGLGESQARRPDPTDRIIGGKMRVRLDTAPQSHVGMIAEFVVERGRTPLAAASRIAQGVDQVNGWHHRNET